MILRLRETQGKTNLKRIQTSLEKVWLSLPNSRDGWLVWPGWSWAGVAAQAGCHLLSTDRRAGDQWPGCVAQFLCWCIRPRACGPCMDSGCGVRRLQERYFQAEATRPKSNHVLGLSLLGLRQMSLYPLPDSLSLPAMSLQLPLPRQLITELSLRREKGIQLFI